MTARKSYIASAESSTCTISPAVWLVDATAATVGKNRAVVEVGIAASDSIVVTGSARASAANIERIAYAGRNRNVRSRVTTSTAAPTAACRRVLI